VLTFGSRSAAPLDIPGAAVASGAFVPSPCLLLLSGTGEGRGSQCLLAELPARRRGWERASTAQKLRVGFFQNPQLARLFPVEFVGPGAVPYTFFGKPYTFLGKHIHFQCSPSHCLEIRCRFQTLCCFLAPEQMLAAAPIIQWPN